MIRIHVIMAESQEEIDLQIKCHEKFGWVKENLYYLRSAEKIIFAQQLINITEPT